MVGAWLNDNRTLLACRVVLMRTHQGSFCRAFTMEMPQLHEFLDRRRMARSPFVSQLAGDHRCDMESKTELLILRVVAGSRTFRQRIESAECPDEKVSTSLRPTKLGTFCPQWRLRRRVRHRPLRRHRSVRAADMQFYEICGNRLNESDEFCTQRGQAILDSRAETRGRCDSLRSLAYGLHHS